MPDALSEPARPPILREDFLPGDSFNIGASEQQAVGQQFVLKGGHHLVVVCLQKRNAGPLMERLSTQQHRDSPNFLLAKGLIVLSDVSDVFRLFCALEKMGYKIFHAHDGIRT